jgi:branched-subunit amino acid transport protein
MSWVALLLLAAGSYAFKAAGPLLLGDRELSAEATRLLALAAVPLLAALIVVQTFADGSHLTVDARAPALAVAGVCVWRRAPFLVTVLAAAATAAALRAIT